MVIEQFLPFVSNYDFFDRMGVKVYENGHSYTGVHFSIHSKYSAVPEYERQMQAAYGHERAAAILGEARHNTVYYPSLTIKGAIQTILRTAKTGKIGDGKIFVSKVEEAIRIRDEERGEGAL